MRDGLITKDRMKDFTEGCKEDEDFVQSQIKQLYVLSKMKKDGIYIPSAEDILNAKEGALFETGGKIDFESYFNEEEFKKAVKKHKRDTDRLFRFDLKKVSHFFRKKIKGEEVLLLKEKNSISTSNQKTRFIESLKVEESKHQQCADNGFVKSKDNEIEENLER